MPSRTGLQAFCNEVHTLTTISSLIFFSNIFMNEFCEDWKKFCSLLPDLERIFLHIRAFGGTQVL